MSMTRRSTILSGLALALCPGTSHATPTSSIGGRAFGSTWRLVCGLPDPSVAQPLIAARIAAIDAAMSPYRPGSALSRFNRAGKGEVVEIPAAMALVVRAAIETSRATAGAFDPTIGPLVARFGFGPIAGQPGRIEDIAITGTSLRKGTPGLTLDLCGIAKGYALDRLTQDLIAGGATDFLLELGGEVRAIGTHPLGRPWHIAIEDPLQPRFAARHIVAPGALALATSGHSANGLLGAVETSHVIAPDRARPATGFAASVSVLAPTGMQADALATALLAMGPSGPDFARRNGLSALFILASDRARPAIPTGQFAAHIIA